MLWGVATAAAAAATVVRHLLLRSRPSAAACAAPQCDAASSQRRTAAWRRALSLHQRRASSRSPPFNGNRPVCMRVIDPGGRATAGASTTVPGRQWGRLARYQRRQPMHQWPRPSAGTAPATMERRHRGKRRGASQVAGRRQLTPSGGCANQVGSGGGGHASHLMPPAAGGMPRRPRAPRPRRRPPPPSLARVVWVQERAHCCLALLLWACSVLAPVPTLGS